MRHLLFPVDRSNLIQPSQLRTQAAVDTENPPVDDSSEGQEIKHVGAVSPHVARSVLPLALVVEAVHLRDLARLVVPPDQRDAVRIPNFEDQEEEERLDRVEAAVYEVAWGLANAKQREARLGGTSGRGGRTRSKPATTGLPVGGKQQRTHEDVICFRAVTANLKELHEVEELAVDVAADLMSAPAESVAHSDGAVDVLDVALIHEDLLCLEAEFLDACLRDDLASLQLLDLSALRQLEQQNYPAHLSRSEERDMVENVGVHAHRAGRAC